MRQFPFITGVAVAGSRGQPKSRPTVGGSLVDQTGEMTIASVLWLGAVVTVMVLLIAYSHSPGNAGAPPTNWPAQSQVPLDLIRPTLVMFAHPRCPCTRSSLGELELLLARCPERLSAHVVFIRPAGTSEDWLKTDLWRRANSIPGVTVHFDNGGAEARRFHSETSGQVLLYEHRGRLIFSGGITIARGHSGDNPGRSTIVALLEQERSNLIKTPVFGCSLFEASSPQEGSACSK